MGRHIKAKNNLAPFFRQFHEPRQQHMSWQARVAWYVDTTPEPTVEQTLEWLRGLRAELDRNMRKEMRRSARRTPSRTPADFAYHGWISNLVETMEAEVKVRLSRRIGVLS
jgi:hypothetical protein